MILCLNLHYQLTTGFSRATYENDVSLIKVSEPFNLNARVQPVALPVSGFIPTRNTTAAGWGITSETGGSTERLLKVTVPHVPDEQCRTAYSGRIVDSMICAGVLGEGGKGKEYLKKM